MSIDKVNHLNIWLMLASCAAAFVLMVEECLFPLPGLASEDLGADLQMGRLAHRPVALQTKVEAHLGP